MIKSLVINLETNSLRSYPKLDEEFKVWNVVMHSNTIGDDEGWSFDFPFSDDDVSTIQSIIIEHERIVGHNAVAFDFPILEEYFGISLDTVEWWDTMVVSKLRHQAKPGGHSLEALTPGKPGQVPYDKSTQELLDYCKINVDATRALYDKQQVYTKDDQACYIEIRTAIMLDQMKVAGIPFRVVPATTLLGRLEGRLSELDTELQGVFPPREVVVKTVMVKQKADGEVSKVGLPADIKGDEERMAKLYIGQRIDVTTTEVFNPGSPSQVIDRITGLVGDPDAMLSKWERTDGYLKKVREIRMAKWKRGGKEVPAMSERMEKYGYKINEHNLALAPARVWPLLERVVIANRVNTLKQWLEAYNEDTKRIHGDVDGLGTWPHRMAHRNPNLGNIAGGGSRKFSTPRLKALVSKLGVEMRSLFGLPHADSGYTMVGSDADGIQLRILAHLMGDPEYTKAVCYGVKEDETDIHNVNKKALGPICRSRNKAKTYIYAWLLGAGVGKVSEILDCTNAQAKEAMENFLEALPSLKKLAQDTPKRMGKGKYYVDGLDGRVVILKSERHKLAAYLQNYESTVMKYALVWAVDEVWAANRDGHVIDAQLVNIVHDESLWVCHEDHADELGKILERSYEYAAEYLDVRCPISGGYEVGDSWLAVH